MSPVESISCERPKTAPTDGLAESSRARTATLDGVRQSSLAQNATNSPSAADNSDSSVFVIPLFDVRDHCSRVKTRRLCLHHPLISSYELSLEPSSIISSSIFG